jgi:hypothetical protein
MLISLNKPTISSSVATSAPRGYRIKAIEEELVDGKLKKGQKRRCLKQQHSTRDTATNLSSQRSSDIPLSVITFDEKASGM